VSGQNWIVVKGKTASESENRRQDNSFRLSNSRVPQTDRSHTTNCPSRQQAELIGGFGMAVQHSHLTFVSENSGRDLQIRSVLESRQRTDNCQVGLLRDRMNGIQCQSARNSRWNVSVDDNAMIRVAGCTGIGHDIPIFHGTYPFVIGYTGMSQDIRVCPGTYPYVPRHTGISRDKPL
jgi:hypothetical protein